MFRTSLNSFFGRTSNYSFDRCIRLWNRCNLKPQSKFKIRTLTAYERKYGITELECLAVVWSILYFKQYLLGRKFIVITDHHPLCWLHSAKNISGRLSRWMMKLMEFEFDIIHKKGKAHCNVDCLSRYPMELKNTIETDNYVFAINDINMELSQNADKFCSNIITNIESYQHKGYKIENKVLYRTVKSEFGNITLLVLPRKLITSVLTELHDSKESGHLGYDKTIDRVRQRFYWDALNVDTTFRAVKLVS